MRRSDRLPRRRLYCFVGAVLALTACTNSPINDTDATTLAPIGTGGPVDDTTPPSVAVPTTEPQPGSSVDLTAPLNKAEFRLEIDDGDATGATLPVALVEIAPRPDTTSAGRCLALLGTYTGMRAESLLVSPDVLARAELLTDGDPVVGDAGTDCDRAPIDSAGWGTRTEARLLPGADFNFATVFAVPADSTPVAVRLFVDDPETQRFYEATISTTMPPLPAARAGAAPLNLRATDPTGARPIGFGDDYQTVGTTVRGVISGFARSDGQPGSCIAVIGTIRPTKTIGAIMNSLAAPPVSLIADGVALNPTPSCASRSLTDQGWLGLQYAGVAIGNTFAFAQTFAVSSDTPILQAIAVGDVYDDEQRQLFEPTRLEDLPQAPRREGINPELALRPNVKEVATPVGDGTPASVPAMPTVPTTVPPTTVPPQSTVPNASTPNASTAPVTTAAPSTTSAPSTTETDPEDKVNTYTVSGSPVITIVNEAVWNAHVYGIVGLPSNAEQATCYAILMSWSVSEGEPTDPPPVGLISSGAYWAPAKTDAQCDPAPLTNAGWQDATLADFNDVDDAAMHVFVPIFIPDGQDSFGAIGVGNVADSENVGYVAPVRISAPPAIPGIVPGTSPPTTAPPAATSPPEASSTTAAPG